MIPLPSTTTEPKMCTREIIELIANWVLDPGDICNCLILSKQWRKIFLERPMRVVSNETLKLSWVMRLPNLRQVDALVYLDKVPWDYPLILKDIVLIVSGRHTLGTLVRSMVAKHGNKIQMRALIRDRNRRRPQMFLMGNQSAASEFRVQSLNRLLDNIGVSLVPCGIKGGHWDELYIFRGGCGSVMGVLIYPNSFLNFLKTVELGLRDPLSPPSDENKPLQSYLLLFATKCSTMLVWHAIKCIMELMGSTPIRMPRPCGQFIVYTNSMSIDTIRDYDAPIYNYDTINEESLLMCNIEKVYRDNMPNNYDDFYTSKGELKKCTFN